MNFLIKLLIVIGLTWLTQTLLATSGIKDPWSQIIFIVVIVMLVIWLAGLYSIGGL